MSLEAMDLLSDIGSAAVMLHFIQYAAKACEIVSRLEEKKREGFYEGMFTERTRHFLNFSTLFQSMQEANLDSDFSRNRKALDGLIDNCYDAAGRLRHIFFKIATDEVIRDNNAYLYLRIRKMKEYWNQTEINRLLVELDGYEKMVVMSTLSWVSVRLNAIEQEQSVGFSSSHRSHGKIVEILVVFEDPLDSSDSQQDHQEGETQAPHDNAMVAAIAFQNRYTKYLTTKQAGTSNSYGKRQMMATLQDADSASRVEDFKNIQDVVLDSLYFEQFYERLEAVKSAHKKTYEWIFQPPKVDGIWSPFIEWLENDTGCYYISGKPGSGKSTLIKFTAQEPRTISAIEKWAGSSPVQASFFFWNLGSPLQKSTIGLLRGLLYHILKQQRGLISVTMPDLWNLAAHPSAGPDLDQFSLDDLKRWIRKVLSEETSSLKFFLVIDGIDEFEGDEGDDENLIKLINEIVENKNVKILLSSRPTPLAEASFLHCPKLRLQDLTKGDIRKYAEDHLSESLNRKYGAEWVGLIDEITDRSDGVFLWVILAVRSLQDGLKYGDFLKEMRARLDVLPPNLKELYEHMIRTLMPTYQQQASSLFQLLLKAQEVHSSAGYPLVIQLSFCDDETDSVMSLPMRPLSSDHVQDKCTQFNSRIGSRSRGLIESREFHTNRVSGINQAPISSYYVDFIHRTVVEFLRSPDVWKQLMILTETPKYDPCPELFRSCVIMCKTLKTPRGIDTEVSALWHLLDRALIFASMAEDSAKPVPREHLNELDRVCTAHWRRIMTCFSRIGNCDNEGHWARGYTVDPQRRHILDPIDFSSLALFHGLENYLLGELQEGSNTAAMDTTRLLFNSLRYIGLPPWDREIKFDGSLTGVEAMFVERQGALRLRWVNIAIQLLQVKATDLNKTVVGEDSVWSLMVSYVAAAGGPRAKPGFQRDLAPNGFANLFAKLLGTFIKQGADLSFRATPDAEPAWKLVRKLFSDDNSSSARLDPWAQQPVVVVNTDAMKMREYFEYLVAEHKG